MVVIGPGADHDDDLGLRAVGHLVGDRAGADGLQQRGHRGGMAQAGAMVHVVGAEAGAHQLLEQVGLFVAALGAAEPGQCLRSPRVANGAQAGSRHVQGFFPGRLAEIAVQRPGRDNLRGLGCSRFPDKRPRQAGRVVYVIEAVAPLDAQAALVGGAVTAFDVLDVVVFYVERQQAAHAAIRDRRN